MGSGGKASLADLPHIPKRHRTAVGRGGKAFGRPTGSRSKSPLVHGVPFAIFHRSANGLPRSSHRFSKAFHKGLPGTFRTSAWHLPDVCQEPSGRLPGTFRRSARQASGRPRNDGDLPEVCQQSSPVFPTVSPTRCRPWEGGSARAWQTSGRFLADPPEGNLPLADHFINYGSSIRRVNRAEVGA